MKNLSKFTITKRLISAHLFMFPCQKICKKTICFWSLNGNFVLDKYVKY